MPCPAHYKGTQIELSAFIFNANPVQTAVPKPSLRTRTFGLLTIILPFKKHHNKNISS